MAYLSLSLLGPFQAWTATAAPQSFRTQKERALLAYLAVEHDHPHSREYLAGLFWPDRSEGVARNNLRQALYGLRQAIGEHEFDEIFRITPNDVQLVLGQQVWLDAVVFEMHIKAFTAHNQHAAEPCSYCLQHLRDAAEMYRGSFIADVDLEKNPVYGNWVTLRREEYYRMQLQALENLVDRYENSLDYSQAVLYALRLVQLDQYNEKHYCQGMKLLSKCGRYSAALELYELCQSRLARGNHGDVSEETVVLAEMIRQDRLDADGGFVPIVQHNLPEQLTPFIGREMELSRIARSLSDPAQRLLCVIGPGGVGKTRFAIQAALMHLSLFSDGITFVQLDPITSPAQLAEGIGRAAGLVFDGRQDPETVLIDYLRFRRSLLLLDNFEHLLDGRNLLLRILQAAPFIKIMVTSRERLFLQAEFLLELEGLPYQAENRQSGELRPGFSHEDLHRFTAVALLLERASRVRMDLTEPISSSSLYHLDDPQEIDGVVQICRLVDGLPLGIELAASWARNYSFSQIAAEIQGSLDFLETSLNDLPSRHRSLHASFEHSWNFLTNTEQEVLSKLSVFPGSFSSDAAQSVAGASFPWLTGLVDKSLVRRLNPGRYTLHPLIRQYAGQKLRQFSRKTEEQTRLTHARFFCDLLKVSGADLRGMRQEEALKAVETEMENVSTAWDWAVDHMAVDMLFGASAGLFYHLETLSRWSEGEDRFGRAIAALQVTNQNGDWQRVLAYLLACQGWFSCRLTKYELAGERIAQSLSLLNSDSPSYERAFAHFALGFLQIWQGNYQEAWLHLTTCASLSEQIKDHWSVAWAREVLTEIAYESGQLGQSSEPFEGNLAFFEQIGDKRGSSRVLNFLGMIAMTQEHYAEAQGYFERLLSNEEKIGDLWGAAGGYSKLGQLAAVRGENAQAIRFFKHGLQLLQKTGDRRRIAYVLAELGEMIAVSGSDREADEYFYQALTLARNSQNLSLVQHIFTCRAAAFLSLQQIDRASELLKLVMSAPLADQTTGRRAAILVRKITSSHLAEDIKEPSGTLTSELLWHAVKRMLDKKIMK